MVSVERHPSQSGTSSVRHMWRMPPDDFKRRDTWAWNTSTLTIAQYSRYKTMFAIATSCSVIKQKDQSLWWLHSPAMRACSRDVQWNTKLQMVYKITWNQNSWFYLRCICMFNWLFSKYLRFLLLIKCCIATIPKIYFYGLSMKTLIVNKHMWDTLAYYDVKWVMQQQQYVWWQLFHLLPACLCENRPCNRAIEDSWSDLWRDLEPAASRSKIQRKKNGII